MLSGDNEGGEPTVAEALEYDTMVVGAGPRAPGPNAAREETPDPTTSLVLGPRMRLFEATEAE